MGTDLGAEVFRTVVSKVLVADTEADHLGQEGLGQPDGHQQPVGLTISRLRQTLADHFAGEFVQLLADFGIWKVASHS